MFLGRARTSDSSVSVATITTTVLEHCQRRTTAQRLDKLEKFLLVQRFAHGKRVPRQTWGKEGRSGNAWSLSRAGECELWNRRCYRKDILTLEIPGLDSFARRWREDNSSRLQGRSRSGWARIEGNSKYIFRGGIAALHMYISFVSRWNDGRRASKQGPEGPTALT